jgi:radical SAM-linked protein
MNQALTQQRIRITFGKFGALRFVGHLDLAKTWERVLRRAQVPLEYTQGFNPRPRMQFAAALPVGVTSQSEYLDIWLTERLGGQFPGEWIGRLAATSPAGLQIYGLVEVPIKEAALPTQVTSSEYVITLTDPGLMPGELESRVEALLARSTIERMGHKKAYDLRPLILDLSMDPDGNLIARMKTGEQANGRPDELLDALGLELWQAHIHRRHLYLGGEA